MTDQKHDPPERNYLIDFVKGLLVLSMVVYHALNYTMNESAIFYYLRFIAPGFVGMSGFVITKVLRNKYASRERALYCRLVRRGAKLVGLFTLMNVLIILVLGLEFGKGLAGLRGFAGNLGAIYIAGMDREAVFGVLLPIGYLLILSPLFLETARLHSALLSALGVALLTASSLGPLYGLNSSNFLNFTFGVSGMVAGVLPIRLRAWAWPTAAAVLLAFGGYLVVASLLDPSFLVVLFGTISTLLVFWLIGSCAGAKGAVVARVLCWGRYSLFAYLAQIAVLQVLGRLRLVQLPKWPSFVVLSILTLLLTAMLVELLDVACRRNAAANRIYRAIFA